VELWPDIDKLYEINCEGASMVSLPGGALRHQSSLPSVVRINKKVKPATKRALVDDALGSSSAPPRGRGRGSTRNKAAWILSATPGAISPRMRRSFVDWQYSPSTSMDRSEWEIIFEELTCIGYIVKKELESDGGE
jgi:hypothetical protein